VDPPGAQKPELYDVDRDPALGENLAVQQPEIVERLTRRLQKTTPLAARWRMVRDGRWKLIRIPELNGVRFELYDLDVDPGEIENRADSHPEVVERLRAPLERWASSIRQEAVTVPRLSPAEQQETERRLRALGYIE
jgi:hypothetical protein